MSFLECLSKPECQVAPPNETFPKCHLCPEVLTKRRDWQVEPMRKTWWEHENGRLAMMINVTNDMLKNISLQSDIGHKWKLGAASHDERWTTQARWIIGGQLSIQSLTPKIISSNPNHKETENLYHAILHHIAISHCLIQSVLNLWFDVDFEWLAIWLMKLK